MVPLLCVVALVVVTHLSLEPANSASRSPQEEKLKDPQFIAEGGKLFAPNCGTGYCHGAGGLGGGAPRLRGKGLDAPYLFKTISNGVPRTPMIGFKSDFSSEQIWKLVAFIQSDVKAGTELAPSTNLKGASEVSGRSDKPTAVATVPSPDVARGSLVGDPRAGKAIFFDAANQKSCQSCHSFDGVGAAVGPDLSRLGNKTPRETFLSIILPGETKDPQWATVTLTLRNGEKISGLKKEEDAESIRIYDLTELPAVLRTVQKPDIARIETTNESPMPKDYVAVYTLKQLLDIVTFLKSSDPQSRRVSLKDILSNGL